jgi:uncharacterized protein
MTPTILTHSGKYFDFTSPESHKFDIEDIAQALSNICRFNGQCDFFYSVAQHSVGVSHLVPPEHALGGLLHDAAEAYLGDVTAPLKARMPDYRKLETRVERAVLAQFGLPETLPPCVKKADLMMLKLERQVLFSRDPGGEWETTLNVASAPASLLPWGYTPSQARDQFLARFSYINELFRTAP